MLQETTDTELKRVEKCGRPVLRGRQSVQSHRSRASSKTENVLKIKETADFTRKSAL